MKNIVALILFWIVSGLSFLSAQTISFYFVAPLAAMNANFPGQGRADQMPSGYAYVQITNANAPVFLAHAPEKIRYVYNQLQPGTNLHAKVDKILNNSGRRVDVSYFLVDDLTGFTATTAMFASVDGHHVWPAANNSPLGARYVGWVGLGEHHLRTDYMGAPGGLAAIDEVVLHETSHTQFVGTRNRWGAVSGVAISYGADGQHYIVELMGAPEMALDEGLGTFFGYTMNRVAMEAMMARFQSTADDYFVEGRSFLAGVQQLSSVASRRQDILTDEHNRPIRYPDGRDVIIFRYPWRDVPGVYLPWAETIPTAFFSLYWDNAYSNKDTSFSFIQNAAYAMHDNYQKRFLSYAVNRIALKMEEYNASAPGQADASKTSSMLPFAILDLVTHFGMSDAEYRADYDRHYPDRQPRAYAEYFTRRTAIRQLVQDDLNASPVRFNEAMQKIKDYCRRPDAIF